MSADMKRAAMHYRSASLHLSRVEEGLYKALHNAHLAIKAYQEGDSYVTDDDAARKIKVLEGFMRDVSKKIETIKLDEITELLSDVADSLEVE